jgi:hypothetical protein
MRMSVITPSRNQGRYIDHDETAEVAAKYPCIPPTKGFRTCAGNRQWAGHDDWRHRLLAERRRRVCIPAGKGADRCCLKWSLKHLLQRLWKLCEKALLASFIFPLQR